MLAIAAGLVALSVADCGSSYCRTVLVPIVAWLRRRGVPSLVATWVTRFGAILLVGGISVALTTAALREIDGLNLSIGQGLDRVERWLVTGPLGLEPEPLGRIREQGGEWLFGNAGGVSGQLIGGASLVLELIAGLLLAIVLLFFFVKDGPAIWAWLVRQWPVRWGPHIDEAGRRSWTMLSGYLRGTALIALIHAILIGIALALIGVPFVLPLSMLTFLGGFLPLIGASVAGIIAALVALVSGGVVDALLVLGVIIVIQQVEGDLLAPLHLGQGASAPRCCDPAFGHSGRGSGRDRRRIPGGASCSNRIHGPGVHPLGATAQCLERHRTGSRSRGHPDPRPVARVTRQCFRDVISGTPEVFGGAASHRTSGAWGSRPGNRAPHSFLAS